MINKLIALFLNFIYNLNRKKEIMAKKQESAQELEIPDDVGNKLTPVELNDEAFSISKDKTTGKYHLVTIKYDFDTKTVGNIEIGSESNDEKLIMFDNMKIAIGKYLWR